MTSQLDLSRMGDVGCLLRALQGLCTTAAALERDERVLDCLRERMQRLLDCAGKEALYPDRAAELWTEYGERCEAQTARLYGIAPVARASAGRMCNEHELIADAAEAGTAVHDRCVALIDLAMRGERATRLYPTFYDAAADLADVLRGGADGGVLPKAYLALTECARGMIDPSRGTLVRRASALCVRAADVLRGGEAVAAFDEGAAFWRDLCDATLESGAVGVVPAFADCMLRLSLRARRLYAS